MKYRGDEDGRAQLIEARAYEWYRQPALPLLELAQPTPALRTIGDSASDSDDVVLLSLAYGDPRRSDGPLVIVTVSKPEFAPDLDDALDAELSRIGLAIGRDSLTAEHATLTCDGTVVPINLTRLGRFDATQFHHGGVVVTVVTRDWPIEGIVLVRVRDVEPYIEGRRYLLSLPTN